jgi:hypothetical protein
MDNNSKSYLGSERREEFTKWTKKLRLVQERVKGSQRGSREEEEGNRESENSDVVFLGLQIMPSGKAVPLYNIIKKNHLLFKSTVTEDTLHKHNLQVPQIPCAFNKKSESSDPLKKGRSD